MAAHSDAEARSKTPIQIAVCIIFLTTTWLTCGLRIYVRARLLRSFGWDDATMLATVIFFTLLTVSLFMIIHFQATMHGPPTTPANIRAVGKILAWRMGLQIFYILSICFLKVSLGIFFLRLVNQKWQKRIIYAVMIIVSFISFCHIWIVIFMCGNPKNYRVNYAAKKCMPRKVQIGTVYEYAVVNAITDWVLVTIPFYILWTAQMSRRSKVSVALILMLGLLGSVCSIIRFLYVGNLSDANEAFWSYANIAIWSTIEPGVGITAGCLITLRPLLKRIKEKIRSASNNANAKHSSPNSTDRSKSSRSSNPKAHRFCPTSYLAARYGSRRGSACPWEPISEDERERSRHKTTTICIGGPDAERQVDLHAVPMDDLGKRNQQSGGKMWAIESENGGPAAGGRDDGHIFKAVNVEVHVSKKKRTGRNTPESVELESVRPVKRQSALGDEIV